MDRYRTLTDKQLGDTLARLWRAKEAPRCANRENVNRWWAAALAEFRLRQMEVI